MKNRKALNLQLNNTLKDVLTEYLKKSKLQGNDYLFPSQKGGMLTDNGFCSSFRKYAAKRCVANAGIHKFRYTFAKHFIIQGENPAKLQQILGHSSIEITMNYVKLYAVDLKSDINTYCILDKLSSK